MAKQETKPESKINDGPKPIQPNTAKRGQVVPTLSCYINGFSDKTTKQDIESKFSEVGEVTSIVMNTVKKHALVQYKTEAEALFAIDIFHGTDFEGRKLKVTRFQPAQKQKLAEAAPQKKK